MELSWDWLFFGISLFTLLVMLFVPEYKKHKKNKFENTQKYSRRFWIFNLIYVIAGATIATLIGIKLGANDPISAIIYAGGWEAIFNNLIQQERGDKDENN